MLISSRLVRVAAAAALIVGAAGPLAHAAPRMSPTDSAASAVSVDAPTVARQAKACSAKNTKPFVPVKIAIGSITKSAKVIAVNRAAGEIPGTPPISTTGKNQVAWDKPGIQPASATGHVLMNAHAWPDGTALGNKMMKSLKPGHLIKVYGAKKQVQCYKVSRIQTAAPSPQFTAEYFGSLASKAELGLLTCSGVRLGPGHWSTRTVFWATPIA